MICNELGISNHSLTDEEWVRTSRSGNGVNWNKNLQGPGIAPDVFGMTFRDALYLLEKAGLTVFFEGSGRVETQSIRAGARVAKGDRIYLTLG